MVTLRPTRDEELDSLREAEKDPDTRRWLGDVSAEWHRNALDGSDIEHLSIVGSGRLVGFVVLAGLTSGEIELRRIVTVPEHRGKGLGRAALNELVDRAFDAHGAYRLWLDVKVDNTRARTLYESAGFVAERVVENALREPDGSYSSLLIMALSEPDRR
jgi:RimJ/RimL family protein N-acetyltransferase